MERSLDDQLLTRPFSRSCTKENIFIFEPHIYSGSPRYILMPPSEQKPRASFMSCFRDNCTLFPKKTEDFDAFSRCHDAFPYMSRMSMISLHWLNSALQKKRLSSANSRWKILGLALATRRPSIFFSASAPLKSEIKASVHMMNKKGERGSPCLNPLLGKIHPLGCPLTTIWYVTDVTQHIMRSTSLLSNPIFNIKAARKLHSTLS